MILIMIDQCSDASYQSQSYQSISKQQKKNNKPKANFTKGTSRTFLITERRNRSKAGLFSNKASTASPLDACWKLPLFDLFDFLWFEKKNKTN